MSGDVYWILIPIHNILFLLSCSTLLWSKQKVFLHFTWHTQNSRLPNSINCSFMGYFFVMQVISSLCFSSSFLHWHMFLKVVQNLHFFNLSSSKKRKEEKHFSICMIISLESFRFAFISYSGRERERYSQRVNITNLIKLKIKKFIVEWQHNVAATNALCCSR